ncbi:MAG: cell division protein FtsQ/DivIB [Pseudomonas sp.]|nr:cell division protein FtsQ/DivIB [Pseudomonas sp.]MDD2221968.1 cell division protein FtsQ/DivIB [Pseudomonas sp.]MDY0413306.1 cell division protein FtsQ/DivIB [Pseudomonas sp.]NLO53054.1 FtsQ-type POTRA domain-containing protein [Gammaproteobacteria bacterium]
MSSAQRRTKTAPPRGATRQAPARGASRTAVRQPARQWPKPNWTLISLLAVVGLLLALLLNFERFWQATQPYINPPIAKIRVLTELSTAKQQVLEKQLMPYADGLFFSVDIGAVRHAVEELPWVVNAEVSRIWPNQLQVIIQEQLPVARWGGDALLSTQGYLFNAIDIEAYGHLPQLSGPKDAQGRVMQQYLVFSQALRPLGYSIKKLQMRERGSWFVTTQTGLKLLFGRDHLVEKMRRFAVVHKNELQGQIDKIERVDLRYANGLAVAWRAPTEAETTAVVTR